MPTEVDAMPLWAVRGLEFHWLCLLHFFTHREKAYVFSAAVSCCTKNKHKRKCFDQIKRDFSNYFLKTNTFAIWNARLCHLKIWKIPAVYILDLRNMCYNFSKYTQFYINGIKVLCINKSIEIYLYLICSYKCNSLCTVVQKKKKETPIMD